MKTQTRQIEPEIALDEEDLSPQHEAALAEGILRDELTIAGRRLRPITIGTAYLMRRAGSGLIDGQITEPERDMAIFLAVHAEDNTEARRAIFEGGDAIDELVFSVLDRIKVEDAEAAANEVICAVNKLGLSQTDQLGGEYKKKSGLRTMSQAT